MALTKKTLAPKIVVNATGDTPITSTSINFSSTNATGSGGAAKVQYTFMGLTPSIGAITKGGAPVSTFTQADLNAGGVITYSPDRSNKTVLTVVLKLRVTDLTDGSSQVISINIEYSLPDVAPEGTVSPLIVPEDGESKVTQTNINFTDLFDAPNAIFIVIQAWPQHGDMLFNGKLVGPGSTQKITMADIIAGKLSYKHNGDEVEEDHLFFKVRDTKNKWSGVSVGEQTEENASVYDMPIKIVLEDLPLVVTKNGPLNIVQCETLPIGADLLEALDEDDPDLALTWTLTKLPMHGILYKNGTPMTVGTTWTNSDIAGGKITFEQDCSDTPSDEFEFSVGHSKQTLEKQKFPIKLIPNLPPIIVIKPLEVPKCETGVASEKNIKITDPEGLTPKDLKLKFAPNTPETPAPKHGMIRINGMSAMAGVTEFTYQDILDGKFSYVHDCTTHDPLTDEFWFYVIDGGHEILVKLPIIIIVTEDKPPYLTENKIHPVERNGEVNWKVDEFNFADDDTDAAKVFWELTALPEHGELFINGAPAKVGDKFALSVWKDIKWRYVAGAPDNSIMEDRAFFKLYDETNVVEDLELLFVFPEPPTVCPDIINIPLQTAFTLKKAISEIDLFASNEGIQPTELVWTLVTKPKYGTLNLNTVEVVDKLPDPNAPVPTPAPPPVTNTWTSKDILDLKLTYTHTTDTPPEDEFEFTVTNGFCTVSGKYRIVFVPGLIIEINRELEVVQGGEPGVIDKTYLLSSSGSVTDPARLVYIVTELPKVGKIFVNGEELVLDDNVVSFSQADINNGVVTYVPDLANTEQDFDTFKFTVSDGIETREDIFRIKIILKDLPPEMIINELAVGELMCGTILHSKHIIIKDKESSTAQLVFTLLTIPENGDLILGDKILAVGDTFTYQDISNGALGYCSTVEGATLDSFDFSLVDSGGNELTPNTFPIKIIPPPPPELVNNGMIIEPCTPRAITPVMLTVANLRSTVNRETVVFTVRSLPKNGVLSNNKIPLVVGGTFTLKDIIGGNVTYTSSTFKKDPDSFKFDVNSDVFNQAGNTFEIKFKSVNNPPWICANTGMTVFELETKPITTGELQMCDVDLDRDDVNDPDPDSVEDNAPVVHPEGQVITKAEVDEVGRVSKDVNINNPGKKMQVTFTVTAGSARGFVRSPDGAILVTIPCQTASNGSVKYEFTTSATTAYVTCQVLENCAMGDEVANWTFDLITMATA